MSDRPAAVSDPERAAPVVAPGADRFLLGIVAGAVLLIVLGIVAVFVAGRASPPPPPDPSSPVGVVQAYIEALRAGEPDRAYTFLSRSAQASMPLDEYRRPFSHAYRRPETEQRWLIEPVMAGADTAEVRVTLSRFSSSPQPFSATTYHRDETVRLVREDGTWRINQPVGPFPFLY